MKWITFNINNEVYILKVSEDWKLLFSMSNDVVFNIIIFTH